jgi:chorismate mutase / prephenate dehydratase
MTSLSDLRAQIDQLDSDILRLLNQRATVAQAVGHLKQQKQETAVVYRPEREAQILRRMAEENQGPLPNHAITAIYRAIIAGGRGVEEAIKVGYLGPEGTFSHAATLKHFGQTVEAVPLANFDAVYLACEAEQVHYIVVPVVNSTEGFIGRTLDLAVGGSLKVCGEIEFRVRQNLLTHCVNLSDITEVFSHAQSLAQTAQWLARHLPTVKTTPVASNAEAARLASLNPTTAAVSGELAATQYQLPILSANIEDNPHNTTRFWVLGKQAVPPSGHDKTSLALAVQNVAGAIHQVIAPLAKHSVSMAHIESRPMPGSTWEYVFLIDLEGHAEQPHVAAALAEIAQQARFYKCLGSYPKAIQ